MNRRALAFDLVQVCGFHVMNGYHADLFDHLHHQPPPGYSSVSLAQILRSDRAAWLHIAEKISSITRDALNKLPLEEELKTLLAHPSVSFHLLPLPAKGPEKPAPAAPKPKATPKRVRSRSPKRLASSPPKGKGKGKGNKRGRGPNVPKGLIGKNLQTTAGERLCWAFNLQQGCSEADAAEDFIFAPSQAVRSHTAFSSTSDKLKRMPRFCRNPVPEATTALPPRGSRYMKCFA